jgi:hypothetical protein
MATFKVTLKRISYATVTVEAPSAAEVRRILSDDDTAWEHFAYSNNVWHGREIKIDAIKRETEEA